MVAGRWGAVAATATLARAAGEQTDAQGGHAGGRLAS